jgi:hypothetical protein
MTSSNVMSSMKFAPVLALALLAAVPLQADDVCSAEEHRVADAGLARAQAAESSGDLVKALKLVDSNEVRGCGDYKAAEAMIKRITQQLGSKTEASGDLKVAFDYFTRGGWFDDAKRVGLKQLAAAPADFDLAYRLMAFMQQHELQDGAGKVRENARQQAQQLLAEEQRTFAVRTPRRDLLETARDWLRLAGDPIGPVEERAVQRGDSYLALDYAYALQQALGYYEFAGREDKVAAVRTKARGLADQLADGDNWAAAVELYLIAEDTERAEQLEARRKASAAATEETRKEEFLKEQDELEKELDL